MITMKVFMFINTSIMVLIKCPYNLKILKKYKNLNQMKKLATAFR